jgi:hypothetical protein
MTKELLKINNMKYKIAQKAYEIDFSKIEEGFLYDSSGFITYSETRNKAKTQLLEKAYCESICLRGEEDEVTYLTIPVLRCKEADKYFFEDKQISLYKIEEILSERKRLSVLDGILNNENIKYCYIIKGSYYRPNACGYTDLKSKAGVYTKEDAVSSAKSCRDIYLEIIDIKDHNKMIQIEIRDLENKILK